MTEGFRLGESNGRIWYFDAKTGEAISEVPPATVMEIHRVLSGNCWCCRGWRFDNMSGRWAKIGGKHENKAIELPQAR